MQTPGRGGEGPRGALCGPTAAGGWHPQRRASGWGQGTVPTSKTHSGRAGQLVCNQDLEGAARGRPESEGRRST